MKILETGDELLDTQYLQSKLEERMGSLCPKIEGRRIVFCRDITTNEFKLANLLVELCQLDYQRTIALQQRKRL